MSQPLAPLAPRPGVAARWGHRTAAAAALACLLGTYAVGYLAGQREPAMHHAVVGCLSAQSVISCTDDSDAGNSEFWIPIDVAWTDEDGVFHLGDRPECLPPVGRGVIAVQITWVEVDIHGTSFKQAVGVHC